MPKPTVVISVVCAVVALVVAGVLVSMLGKDEPAGPRRATPRTRANYGERTVRFAYPRAWGEVERRTERGVDVARVFGPPDADGARSVVRMTADPDTTISFESQYGLIDGQDRLQLRNDEEISVEDADVPGARQAKRRVLEYDYAPPGGAVQRSRSSTMFALADGGLSVIVTVDTPAAGAEVDADAVLESLTLDG